MKPLLTGAAIVALATLGLAIPPADAQEAQDTTTFCTQYESFAKLIVEVRYKGVPMGKIMELVDKDIAQPEGRALLRDKVQQGYALPFHYTDEMREIQALKFSQEAAVECYEARGSK